MPTTIVSKSILSCSDTDNTFPWCKFSIDPLTKSLTVSDFNGLLKTTLHSKVKGQYALTLNPLKATEPHALFVTEDGTVKFEAFSDQPAICYAHLAFYYPQTDTLEVLDFKPMHTTK